jgi:hypothetical protein
MATMFHTHEQSEEKMHAPARELVLRPKDGKPMSVSGQVDQRLFKGGNAFKAIQGDDGLWFCKYEQGNIPESLKVKFTSISKLLAFVKPYWEKRNIEIVEVKDLHAT